MNSKIIVIPEGVTKVSSTMPEFKYLADNNEIEEVFFPDSVTEIGPNTFKGSKNLKKVHLPNNLKMIYSYAFADCPSLEEINIPSSIHFIDEGVFYNCENLKELRLHDNIKSIGAFALYGCKKLTNFKLPKYIDSLGRFALCECDGINEIAIPKSLIHIEGGALSKMKSLSKIFVEEGHKVFISIDDISLIDKENEYFVQYAINAPNKTYSINTYKVEQSEFNIYGIANNAFAGTKNIETLNITSCIITIYPASFSDCENLKNLKFTFKKPFINAVQLKTLDFYLSPVNIAIENLIFEEGIEILESDVDDIFKYFNNTKTVTLPNSLKTIKENVFSSLDKINNMFIPDSVNDIYPDTFHDNTVLVFDKLYINASNFTSLETFETSNGKVKIISLKDGTYYASIDSCEYIKITKEDISSMSPTTPNLSNRPAIFVDYIYNLFMVKYINNTITEMFSKKDEDKSFKEFINGLEIIKEIVEKNNDNHTFNNEEEINDFIFNDKMMRILNQKDLQKIISNISVSLLKFFKYSELFIDYNGWIVEENEHFREIVSDNISRVIDYCKLLEKYHLYDRFLYNKNFAFNLTIEEQELFLSHYNANIKRLFKYSKILDIKDNNGSNIKDLIKLCRIMGIFSDNEILSQKTSNFITERIFANKLSNDKNNEYQIVGDDIHRVFGDIILKDKLDYDFIVFFIENYQELLENEKEESGFIARCYTYFDNIKGCSTSNRGSQRQLKVTVAKCKEYFQVLFNSLNDDEHIELYNFLKQFFTEKETFLTAIDITTQSEKAPRNIFTKINYDDLNRPIYDYDSKNDLFGSVNDLSYQWLPKQNYYNLVLGKFCNCCAHIESAGAGIAKASMILDNCQNLVIKEQNGRIIAKATIIVNREKQYAIYNNIEINLDKTSDRSLNMIYENFIEATKAFFERYNENNEKELLNISMGSGRNKLENILMKKAYQKITPYQGFDFSLLQYPIKGKMVGTYSGDHHKEQILILTNKKTG